MRPRRFFVLAASAAVFWASSGACGSRREGDRPSRTERPPLTADLVEADLGPGQASGESEAAAFAAALKSRPEGIPAAGEIVVDYPQNGTLFPPDMTSPTFLFRDSGGENARWLVRVSFEKSPHEIFVLTDGRRPEKEYDPRCRLEVNAWEEPPEMRSAKGWTPSERVWGLIRRTAETQVTVTIHGLAPEARPGGPAEPARGTTRGKAVFRISKDPVGAPIFYRDVPLMPVRNLKGLVEPLAPDAVPLITWRLRDLREPKSRVVLKSMPTCGNCHSFSRDGRVLGMDLDGPSGDKGTYGLVRLERRTMIETKNVISWNSLHKDKPTFGLFSRVSPDGRYVVSSVDESVYVANYLDFRFLQAFYSTRGVLAYYDRKSKKISLLPGADDPAYVHCNPVWSPDGKTVVFSRAPAKENFSSGAPLAERTNDPNETQIRYDLCAIPFNGGEGGTARPLAGASGNGRSNSFPKFSPDGKWIVFVQAANGLLLRPDSELHIIPAEGGRARRLDCNTPLMNSWHSFSPNGRWLVFSSKAAKPFTVMYLTHIDEDGLDSPAVFVPNSTAYNRAVNIPEFLPLDPGRLEEILVPAVDYKAQLDAGESFLRAKDFEKAMAALRRALLMKPDHPRILNALGFALSEQGELDEAVRHFRHALEVEPKNVDAFVFQGIALTKKGEIPEAVRCFDTAVGLNPMNFNGRAGLAITLAMSGRPQDSLPHFRMAAEINPDNLDNRYNYGITLLGLGRWNEAEEQFTFVLGKNPGYARAHGGLGEVLEARGDIAGAVRRHEEAHRLSPDDRGLLRSLAWILATASDPKFRDGARAVELARRLCTLTEYKQADAMDALAAALAQAGNFEEAKTWASRALEMTPLSDPRRGERTRLLSLYREKKPYSAPAPAPAGR